MGKFNLNNEMIDMRKDIKRAKIRIISKIVRRVRNLRNKKGTESQLNKNTGRAERLVEDLDMIKELKSDEVFKMLLNSDTKLTAENLMHPDLTPKQRAIIRIGCTSFIQERMSNIKEKVSGFHHARSEKSLPNVFNVIEKIVKKEDAAEVGKQGAGNLLSNDTAHSTSHNDITENLESVDVSVIKNKDDFSKNKSNSIGKTKPQLQNSQRNELSEIESKSVEAVAKEELSDKKEPNQSSDAKINTRPPREEIIIGTAPEGYQIVLPVMSYTKTKIKEADDNASSKFNSLRGIDGVEDVTEILPNIGENFLSENESSDVNSDIELDDLTEHKKKKEQETQDDLFFVDKKGSSNNNFRRSVVKAANSAESSDDEAMNQVKSCFVESLASVSHQRNKGKNRMSQRMRKQQHKKQSNDGFNNAKKPGKNKDASGTKSIKNKPSTETTELKPMHPSWEASRKRKEQQSRVTQFQGKRVCFDDSD